MARANAMVELSVREALKDLRALKKVLDSKVIFERIHILFDKLAPRVADNVRRTQLKGSNLYYRSGELFRAVEGRSVMVRNVPALRVGVFRGPAKKYSSIQESGTEDYNPESPHKIIMPRKAGALAMPNPKNPRVTTPGRGIHKLSGPREYPQMYGRELTFIPFRRGIAIGALYDERQLADEAKKARRHRRPVDLSNIEPAYILLSQVSLRPAKYLHMGMISYLPEIIKAVRKEIGKMLEEATRGRRE